MTSATTSARAPKLEPELRQRLRYGARKLGEVPWRVREVLVALRRSFIVPVPGLLTERVLEASADESGDTSSWSTTTTP